MLLGGQGDDHQDGCGKSQQGQDILLPVGQGEAHQAGAGMEQNNQLLGRNGNGDQVGEREENQGEQEQGEGHEVDRELCDNSSNSAIFQSDSSLEKVFGPGATELAMRLERGTGREGSISDSVSDSDNELTDGTELTFSTPAKEQRKKRERKFGDISGISGFEAQHDISSEGDPSGGTNKEVKKPRLAESMGTEEYEEDKDEVPPGDPEPPDGVATGALELPGVGGQHEDVPLMDTGFHDDVSHGAGATQ